MANPRARDANAPALVIYDVPVVEGRSTLRRNRCRNHLPDVPFVRLSYAGGEDACWAVTRMLLRSVTCTAAESQPGSKCGDCKGRVRSSLMVFTEFPSL